VISAVVAVRSLEEEERVINNLKAYPFQEIILAEGKNPSLQRNMAVNEAQGDIIYFFDDDSALIPGGVESVLEVFNTDSSAAVCGGPALTPDTDTRIQKSFGAVLASSWASAKSSARYKKAGVKRYTGEHEMILCNMAVKKDVFTGMNSFREDLYPNEENEFLSRVSASGAKIVYEPKAAVHRSARADYSAFVRQCFNYGRGRGEQAVISFDNSAIMNFIPALFVLYLLFAAVTGGGILISIPFFLYLALTLAFSYETAAKLNDIAFIPFIFLSFFTLHLCYGAGTIFGLVRAITGNKPEIDTEVKLKTIRKI